MESIESHLSETTSSSRDGTVESLVERELGLPDGAIPRNGKNRILEPPGDLAGLALSGGGIRSATFNLGLLQGLNELRLLDSVDYLSTVSGGGYVGSFWTAWRSRRSNASGTNRRVFPEPGRGEAEAEEVRHLREFARYLAPRIGLFRWDTGRVAVALTSSIVPSMMAAISVITLVLLLWSASVGLLFHPAVVDEAGARTASVVTFALILAALLTVAEMIHTRRHEPGSWRAYLFGSALAIVVAGGGWSLLTRTWTAPWEAFASESAVPVLAPGRAFSDWGFLLLPPLVLVGTAAVFSLRRLFMSRFERTPRRKPRRASFDRVHGQLLFAAAAWMVISGLWVLGAWVHDLIAGEFLRGAALGGATGAAVGGFAWSHRKIATTVFQAARPKMMGMLAANLPVVLSYTAVALLVASTVAMLQAFGRWLPIALTDLAPGAVDLTTSPSLAPVLLALPFGLIIAAVLFFMDPNEVGLHAFYKGRIARAYPGASNIDTRPIPVEALFGNAHGGWGNRSPDRRRTEEQPGDDLRFARVPTPTGHEVAAENDDVVTRERPVHLVCCAANDLTADPVATLNRGAVSAVLSPIGFSVDRDWAPWEVQIGAPTLAHAVTASGAAFNSLMGAYSVRFGPAATFLLAALNLRLGLWLPHPTRSPVHRRRRRGIKRWMIGLPFFREMAGAARATSSDVHLSDGGHFENLGIYELVRRHCRFIIASDSSADPDVTFNDFGNLVRRVREDFGVDIRIDLSPLRPDPATGLSRQHLVAGDIHYPEGDTGILLYFKPAITGTESADILQYRARSTTFPHESTVNQFFDESQWESYRQLGQHAVITALGELAPGLDRSSDQYARKLLGRARRRWQARPSGFDKQLQQYTDRVAALEGLLREEHCEELLRQVYRELPVLDPRRAATAGIERSRNATSTATLPSGRELATSLSAIRTALLTFAEIFESAALDRNHNHPLFLGVMNYIARWAHAPLFHFWWPVLRALCPRKFTRFMEVHFGLPPAGYPPKGGIEVVLTSASTPGFAAESWRLQGNRTPPDAHVLAANLRLRYLDSDRRYRVQVAQVITAQAEDGLVWIDDDFYVPPGLWGVGIGETFLNELVTGTLPVPDIRQLYACIPTDGDRSTAGRRAVANQIQLYRAAGFSESSGDLIPAAVRQQAAMLLSGRNATGPIRWMTSDAGSESEATATQTPGMPVPEAGA